MLRRMAQSVGGLALPICGISGLLVYLEDLAVAMAPRFPARCLRMAEQTLFSLIVEFLLVGSTWALLVEVAVVFVVYDFVGLLLHLEPVGQWFALAFG